MRKLSYILFGAGLLLTASCKKELQEINTNPNAPISAQPELLMRQVIYDYGENMSYEGFVAGNLLGQYFTAVDFNLFDRHDLASAQYGGKPWPFIYTNLRDNELLLQKSRTEKVYAVYEGPALILKAYLSSVLTDLYGDVPYFEALQGKDGNVTPAYSKQEDIYNKEGGILDNLDKGIAAINAYDGKISLGGDILYSGNMQGWVKFANSLKIKCLMRISGKQNVSAQLQKIYDEGNYIKVNTDNAKFDFTDGPPNNFRMSNIRIGDFKLFIMSETIEEILKDYNDPRIATFFRPTVTDPNDYKGLLNGPDASQTSITVDNYSLSGTIFREHTGDLDANFMTAWETQFLLAEAAERGYISADAQMLYETAVKNAFEYWQTPMPSDYLISGNGAYGMASVSKIEQIITQKWIANIINGYEGWNEYRRTGYPKLKTISGSLNNNLIPIRMPYPIEESALNTKSYNAAASATNGNSINAKVWWDAQ